MKIHITTLGCKVNQYESGQILAKYLVKGYVQTKTPKDADVCIVNTCVVTSFAEKKSRYQVARIKRQNPDAEIIVCGCATDRNLNKEVCKFGSIQTRKKHYIKVQDGCDNFCSYCIVPYIRGRSTSRPVAEVLKEIGKVNKPIILTGIDLSSYAHLAELCAQIDRPFELSSLEVCVITPDFLQALKSNKHFIPNFHLSLQSGSDRVLSAMNRKYTTAEYFEKTKLIRKHFQNARLTTDIICGFPTETEEEHRETIAFVRKVKFDGIHVFPYSRRTGTKAADMPQIQDSVITGRTRELQNIL
jgi:threonylcarbamoyladenosine tRNA methylthiotransferase MtaB